MSFASFEELSQSRRDWYEISKKNGFVEGIERLLTKLYPDKAHFIFELLQNAEDAEATKVEFRLEADSLVFVHNGRRLFNLRDVESITSIADSTKRDDGTSIGKFGIGFKAVFAYTETPMIHSGEWHFMISHMVVPERCDKDADLQLEQEGKTFFRFPFNKKQKDPVRAYTEILDGLKALGPESILFLRNISEVYVSYSDKEQFITKNTTDHLVELLKLTGEGEETSNRYLLFSKVVEEMPLEDGSIIGPMSVGIGYRLKERNNGKTDSALKLSDRYEIAPVERRNVYVFFPAEKETSGLRFCLHAPFASTAARDSICDTVDNRNLMGIVSGLQVDSLTYLRDEGFLTTDFLSILPNSNDVLGEMYKCFWEKLVAVFKGEDFTPTRAGGYAPGKSLRSGEAEFAEIIGDDDLSRMCGKGTKWVKNARQRNQNADKFLKDLEIPKYGMSELVTIFVASKLKTSNWGLVQDILSHKDKIQLRSLYVELYKYIQKLESNYFERDRVLGIVEGLKRMPIIVAEDCSLVCPNDVYLARQDRNSDVGESVKFVHPEMFGEGSNQKDALTHFFAKLGIVVYDEAASMKLFIDNYWNERSNLSDDDCVRHLSQLVSLVARGVITPEIARRFPIKNSDGEYVEISKIYIDKPYQETGLSCMKSMLQANNRSLLNPSYYDALGESGVKALLDHLADYDIQSELEVCDSPVRSNPRFIEDLYTGRSETDYGREYDYDIPGLESCVGNLEQQQGEMIWSLILRARNKLEAFYSANGRDSGRYAPSKYICTLKDAEWIVCRDGNRCKPCDVTFENLPDGWIVPDDGYQDAVLKAIGFGSATETQREEQEKKDQVFKASGFDSAKEVEELKELKMACNERGLTIQQALSQLTVDRRHPTYAPKELPKRSASDVNQRILTASANFQKAAKQTHVVVGRTVHVGNSQIRDAARTYLRAEYELNGEMFCQLCHSSMPFKGRDGYGYFEATQVFARMKKDITEQFISLCPTCRAKYDEWVRRSQGRSRAFKDAILRHKPHQGEESVTIPLPGEPENGIKSPLSGRSIYFTGTHFVDLRQAVMENEKLGGLDDFTELESASTGSSASLSFIDWYLKYDPQGGSTLKQITDAFASLEKCRQQGKKAGVVMWTTCSEGYLKKVMTFWEDYHSQFPAGESQADASMSVERYCKSRMQVQ